MQKYLMEIIIISNNIIGILIVIRFYNHLLMEKEMNSRVKVMGLLLVLTGSIVINIEASELGLSLLAAFLIYFILALLFYHGKVHMKLIVAIFVVIFSFITELLTALLFVGIFGNVMQNIRENTMYLFLGGVVSKIILMILVESIIRYRSRNRSQVSLSAWLLIISIPMISIMLSITSVYEPIMKNTFSSISMLSCLFILYINIITFYLFDNVVQQVEENNKYKFREHLMRIQHDQYENIIEGYNQVKKVRHDMVGHLITLDGYLIQKQHQEAIEYIHKLSGELDLSKSGIISNNVVVDALINNKKSRTQEEGIEFIYDITIPKKLKIGDVDLCIVLGNALNNAIEGCLRIATLDKKKSISIKIKYKSQSLLIELKNSYDLNSIKKQNGKYISSKQYREKNELGIGIGNIEEIMKKYGGIFQTKPEEELFITQIMIPDVELSI